MPSKSRSKVVALVILLSGMVALFGASRLFLEPPAQLDRRKAMLAASAVLLASGSDRASAKPDWQGSYEDSKYPGCKRDIGVVDTKLFISGYDANPGPECSLGVVKPWNKVATLASSDAETFSITSEVIGSRKKFVKTGKWNGNGISWDDGSTWTKQAKGAATSGPQITASAGQKAGLRYAPDAS